jgi:hypothetical protein
MLGWVAAVVATIATALSPSTVIIPEVVRGGAISYVYLGGVSRDGEPPPLPVEPLRPPHEEAVADALLRAGAEPGWLAPFLVIVRCESGFNLSAIGDHGASLGIFQLWYGWFPKAGESRHEFRDLDVSARVAVYVRRVRGRFGGPGGWTCADMHGIW